MERKRPDGGSNRDHLESASRQLAMLGRKTTTVVPSGPPFPHQLRYLWVWFCELMDGAEPGGMGPSRLTWGTLAAWCALTDISLEPWEARTLIALSSKHGVVSMRKINKTGDK